MRPAAVFTLIAALIGAPACATRQPRTAMPPRIKDTAPEKIAAQRAALSNLNLEAEDQRWGVEAARERKGRSDSAGPPPRLPNGPTDLGSPKTPPSASQ